MTRVLHFVSLVSLKMHNYLVNSPLNSLDLLDRDMLLKALDYFKVKPEKLRKRTDRYLKKMSGE